MIINLLRAASAPLLLLAACAAPAHGQFPVEDPPKVYKPDRPATQKEKDQRASLKAYAEGILLQKEDRLLEALKAFEKAAALDPQVAPVHKAIASLLIALDRKNDALAACRKVLELTPDDAETWHNYAQLLASLGRSAEARAALEKGVKAIRPEENLPLAQQMYYELGVMRQEADNRAGAAAAFARCAELLVHALDTIVMEAPRREPLMQKAAGLFEKVGRLALEEKKYSQALDAYRKAQKVYPPGGGRINLNLAQVSAAQGKLEQAEAYVDAYLRLRPEGREAYELKIQILEKRGRGGDIVPWLERASAQDRHNVSLKMLLARQYVQRSRPAEAEAIYLGLTKDTPSADIYQELFRLYAAAPAFGMGRALDQIDRTLARAKKKDAIAASEPARAQARAMVAALRREKKLAVDLLNVALPRLERQKLEYETVQVLALLADEHRQPQQAERFYRELLRNVSEENEAIVYSGLIRALWKAKKYEEVVSVCRRGLKQAQATNRLLFHSELARSLARLGKTDEALAEADQAIRLATGPARLSMQGMRVRILLQDRRYEAAEKECEALLQEYRQPGDILEVRYLLSHLYSATRNFSKAEEQLKLILEIDPSNATAHNDLGYLWADRGKNLAEAERLIRRAIELDREQRKSITTAADVDQDNAAYIDSLGWVLFRRGKLKEALAELEQATKLPGGDDPVIWDHLGDVCYRLRMVERARQCWAKALQLFEENPTPGREQQYNDLKEKIKQLVKSSAP